MLTMVNIHKLKLTGLQQEILRLLFIKSGSSLNARGIARQLEVTQPAVSKALPLLKQLKLINMAKDKESRRLSIELNRDNHRVIWLKRADNLKQIYESDLIQFLYDNFPNATIILFGSYAFGEYATSSDIDIAIIGAKQKKIKLSDFDKAFERTIFLHYYKSFKDINKNLLNNICSGIILKGVVEL